MAEGNGRWSSKRPLPQGSSDEPLWIRPDSRTWTLRTALALRVKQRPGIGLGPARPCPTEEQTGPIRPHPETISALESLDFRGSPKGSRPFCPCAFQGRFGPSPLDWKTPNSLGFFVADWCG